MKPLIALDRWVGKVESFFLAASLISLLFLTLYSVAYRNLVAPVVLKMQSSEMDNVAPAPAPAAALPAPAQPAAPAPAAAAEAADTEKAPSAGDLDDEPEAPVAAAPAAAAAKAPSAGDLDDEPEAPVAAAPAAAAAKAPSAGDLDDEPEAPVAAAPAAAAAKAPSVGDLDDGTPSPAPAAAPVAPASSPAAAPAVASASSVIPQDSFLLRVLKAFNFTWIDVVTRHLLLWVGFFGAAIAASKRKHIKIDALSRLLPQKGRERLMILIDLVALTACLFLARAAMRFMASETEAGGMFYGALPGWVGIVIIPVGFLLLAWHFAYDALLETLIAIGVTSPELEQWRLDQLHSQEEVA